MGRIKVYGGSAGKNIKPTADITINFDIKHPVFCFRYLHKKYHLDECESSEKIRFMERLCKLSLMTWAEIRLLPRHTYGGEKIEQSAIKGAAIPAHLTKDEVLFAYRFDDLKPMVGYRNKFVFHIVYLDRDFTLYDH